LVGCVFCCAHGPTGTAAATSVVFIAEAKHCHCVDAFCSIGVLFLGGLPLWLLRERETPAACYLMEFGENVVCARDI